MKLLGFVLTLAMLTGPFAGLLYQMPPSVFPGYVQIVPFPFTSDDSQIAGVLSPEKEVTLTHLNVYVKQPAVSFAGLPEGTQCGTSIYVEDVTHPKQFAAYLPGDVTPQQDSGLNHFLDVAVDPPLVIPAGDLILIRIQGMLSCQYEAGQMVINVQYRAK